jgi:hypothetical protein
MKASLVALVGAVLIANCTWTLAASSVDLAVKGSITPSACDATLSQDGTVDYGKIAAKDLSVDRVTFLPRVTLQLRVECEAQTLFALNTRDNRLGSASTALGHYYGLGLINGDQKLGKYQIDLLNPVADTTVYPLFSFDYGTTWIVNSSGSYMGHDYWNAFGDTPVPKALRGVNVDLRIATSIVATRDLTLTEEVPLDGSATLDLVYL